MCARQITGTPVSSSRGIIPAVCGSCSSTTSAGRIRAASASALRGAAALVDRALGSPERPPSSGAVEAVVEALGDAEEVGVAVDHDPARVEPGAADVADQRAQHLGDAAAVRGRVDGPERPAGEQFPAARDGVLEARQPVRREHAAEALRMEAGDGDVDERHGREPMPQALVASRGKPAAGRVEAAVADHLRPGDAALMTTESRELVAHKRLERNRCARLLADEIARSDRWYARREATLVAFDRDATVTVTRLRAEGRIDASIRWPCGGLRGRPRGLHG